MYTRKQLLNKECTHKEYYSQFVTNSVMHRVKSFIGIDRIINSDDDSFNDIPLKEWDALSPLPWDVTQKVKEAGDRPTLAGAVCTYKAAARMIKEGKSHA